MVKHLRCKVLNLCMCHASAFSFSYRRLSYYTKPPNFRRQGAMSQCGAMSSLVCAIGMFSAGLCTQHRHVGELHSAVFAYILRLVASFIQGMASFVGAIRMSSARAASEGCHVRESHSAVFAFWHRKPPDDSLMIKLGFVVTLHPGYDKICQSSVDSEKKSFILLFFLVVHSVAIRSFRSVLQFVH